MAQPSFKLEEPFKSPGFLAGRQNSLDFLKGVLQEGKSINLFGLSGIGKTTLASAVWADWNGPKFWYTVRPKVNDNSQSLLFSLAHFLHLQGAPSLWHQLISDAQKTTDLNLAIGCLQEDVRQIADKTPLFCFDEVDLLGGLDGRLEEQDRVLEILDVIGKITSVIFIGQQAVLETTQFHQLTPLGHEDVHTLLIRKMVAEDDAFLKNVAGWCHGNPRIICLITALYESGAPSSELKKLLAGSSSTRPILERVWKRLTPIQKDIVGMMCVFRGMIPADIFSEYADELSHLENIGLVKVQRRGSLILDGYFPLWVSSLLSPEELEKNHQQVAHIFEERGDFTEAAWHFYAIQEYEQAIDVWYPFIEEEIANGKSRAAAEFFRTISTKKLSQSHKEKLLIIRSELDLLLGRADQLTDHGVETWDDSFEKATFQQNLAKAAFMRGENYAANQLSEDSIDTLARLSKKEGEIRRWRLTNLLREGDLESAKKDIQHVNYQFELMNAIYLDHCGDLDEAAVHLQNALEVAELIDDKDAIAKIKHELAINFGRRGDMIHAEYYSNQAMDWYKNKGDQLKLEGTRANLAGMYLQTGEFDKVIELGQQSLKFFERVKNENWISSLCCNIAEAFYELDKLDKAETFAMRALRSEDSFIQPHAMFTLGLVLQKQNNDGRAKQIFIQAIEIAEQNGDRFIQAYLERALGQLLIKIDQLSEAIRLLEHSTQLFQKMSLSREAEATEKILENTKEVLVG